MIVKPFLLIAVILFSLAGCENKTTNKGSSTASGSSIQQSIKNKSVNDSIIIINGSRLTLLSPINCDQLATDTVKMITEFLDNNIQYFKSDTLIASQFHTEMYYRSFLKKTHFLEFEESSFNKENFTFSVSHSTINNYGTCYIGKYYFANAVNAAQRSATVIINTEKKQMSIWNFNDVSITKEGLTCDFNVRGKHSLYKMNYSDECKRFIVILK